MSWHRRSQRDFEEEIQSHIEIETDRLIEEGMRPEDARHEARRRFGNVTRVQERYHDTGRGVRLEQIAQDVRYALRMLRKTPVFTAMAILTLALGIGADTAVFSVVNGVLLSPLPYHEPQRLVQIWESLPGVDRIMVSYPDYLDWRARNRVFDDVALYSPYGGFANTSGDVPERITGGTATANFFGLLGVRPVLGRQFTKDEDRPGAPKVAMLGLGYWRSHFAESRGVIGTTISLDGEPYTIIGVVPSLPGIGVRDVWTALGTSANSDDFNRGSHPGLIGVGRLKPGVTVQQMNADLSRISREIAAENPTDAAGIGAGGDLFADRIVNNIRPALEVLSWAVLCVLLIACVNVANLILGRGASRRKEVALRRALGASEQRIQRLLLTENLMLALAGGAAGVGLAWLGVRALVSMRPQGVPRLTNIAIDVRVLAFAAAVSILTGLVFGLLPARHAAKSDLNDALKESGRGTSAGGSALRLRGALMIVEVAMALVLLVGAGLLTGSLARLLRVEPGVNADGIVTAGVALSETRYRTEESQRLAFDELLRRVEAVPGVTSAAFSSALPLEGNMQNKLTFEGHSRPKGQEPLLEVQYVTADYFRTMGMRLAAGRGFGPTDVKGGTPSIWIDETIANTYFPGENPVGKWIVHGAFDSSEPKMIVAGVVNDVHDSGLESRANGILYMPFDQLPQSWMTLVVKTPLPFEQVMPAVRREVASFDKQLPLANEQSLAERIQQSLGQQRFTLFLLGVFALVALALAAVGVYGVIAYFVAQRSQEIGIRMALGAQRSNIVSLITNRVVATTSIGVAIGLGAATIASGLMTKLLYEIKPTDVVTYVACAVAIEAIAVGAAVVPTLRATRISPASAMRAD